MPAAFDYGNLLTSQGRGNYGVAPQGANFAQAALGNTQNWAGLAAASAGASAQRDAAIINSAAQTAQQGISSYGSLANSIVSAYGGIAQQGISGAAGVKQAKLAIDQEKARRGSTLGAIAGMAVGAAGLFID
jgi:hypothetical protein